MKLDNCGIKNKIKKITPYRHKASTSLLSCLDPLVNHPPQKPPSSRELRRLCGRKSLQEKRMQCCKGIANATQAVRIALQHQQVSDAVGTTCKCLILRLRPLTGRRARPASSLAAIFFDPRFAAPSKTPVELSSSPSIRPLRMLVLLLDGPSLCRVWYGCYAPVLRWCAVVCGGVCGRSGRRQANSTGRVEVQVPAKMALG